MSCCNRCQAPPCPGVTFVVETRSASAGKCGRAPNRLLSGVPRHAHQFYLVEDRTLTASASGDRTTTSATNQSWTNTVSEEPSGGVSDCTEDYTPGEGEVCLNAVTETTSYSGGSSGGSFTETINGDVPDVEGIDGDCTSVRATVWSSPYTNAMLEALVATRISSLAWYQETGPSIDIVASRSATPWSLNPSDLQDLEITEGRYRVIWQPATSCYLRITWDEVEYDDSEAEVSRTAREQIWTGSANADGWCIPADYDSSDLDTWFGWDSAWIDVVAGSNGRIGLENLSITTLPEADPAAVSEPGEIPGCDREATF